MMMVTTSTLVTVPPTALDVSSICDTTRDSLYCQAERSGYVVNTSAQCFGDSLPIRLIGELFRLVGFRPVSASSN
jgi:hypothetical protein